MRRRLNPGAVRAINTARASRGQRAFTGNLRVGSSASSATY